MRALICIREKDCSWARKLFGTTHPAILPICNKPLAEYLLDFAILSGCTGIRLVTDEPDKKIERYFDNGSRWGVEISYASSRTDDSIDTILKKNEVFCRDHPLLILDGFFFIHYDKSNDYLNWDQAIDSGRIISCRTGAVLFARNSDDMKNLSSSPTQVDFALSPLESFEDIHQISMQVLDAEQSHYVLPGYSAEKGILIGRNVEISKGVQINPPAIIGDNSRLLHDCVIGPGAIVDNSVIVDSNSNVHHSILIRGSYVGRNLSIENKIVNGSTIFDSDKHELITIEDAFLFSGISEAVPWYTLRSIVNRLLAGILLVVLIPAFLVLGGIRKLRGDWEYLRVRCFLSPKMDTIEIETIAASNQSFTGKLFSALFLDKIPLIWQAFRGRLLIIGNQLLPVSEHSKIALSDFPDYQPGAFSYTEADGLPPDTVEAEVAERFYAAHRSFVMDFRMLVKAVLAGICKRTPSPLHNLDPEDDSELFNTFDHFSSAGVRSSPSRQEAENEKHKEKAGSP